MQDHYETLQVHPRADAEAIEAAYQRLRERYDPSRLEGAADELVELARRRRDDIERAYTILSDPQRRAVYDAEQAKHAADPAPAAVAGGRQVSDDDLIDYRPLPPARRQERPEGFNAQPYLPSTAPTGTTRGRTAGGQPVWLMPALLVGIATFTIVLVTLISTVMSPSTETTAEGVGPNILDAGQPTAMGAAPTASIEQIINQFEGQVIAARQVANQVPENPNAWIELGHALYDSVVVIRERLGTGDTAIQNAYIERLPRWLEAGDAYRQALELQPEDATIRADLAASLCYYGKDANASEYVAQGLSEAEQALAAAPENGRVLLSMGLCLAFSDPPQTDLAMQQWQKAVILTDVEPGVVAQARQLIAEYSLNPAP